mmetsp:Transcript_35837/g.57773  ORF Transcript_35837/g.57773 Transcript_35837/m.57773 type:complete len:219 (-) Transcript_35837:939-1595(-)
MEKTVCQTHHKRYGPDHLMCIIGFVKGHVISQPCALQPRENGAVHWHNHQRTVEVEEHARRSCHVDYFPIACTNNLRRRAIKPSLARKVDVACKDDVGCDIYSYPHLVTIIVEDLLELALNAFYKRTFLLINRVLATNLPVHSLIAICQPPDRHFQVLEKLFKRGQIKTINIVTKDAGDHLVDNLWVNTTQLQSLQIGFKKRRVLIPRNGFAITAWNH